MGSYGITDVPWQSLREYKIMAQGQSRFSVDGEIPLPAWSITMPARRHATAERGAGSRKPSRLWTRSPMSFTIKQCRWRRRNFYPMHVTELSCLEFLPSERRRRSKKSSRYFIRLIAKFLTALLKYRDIIGNVDFITNKIFI